MGDPLLGEEGSEPMESVRKVRRKRNGKKSRFGNRYGIELKLRCVKLRVEEGLPVSLLSKEVRVSKDVDYRWVKRIRNGEKRVYGIKLTVRGVAEASWSGTREDCRDQEARGR
jgi:transposase-like protein